MNLPTGLKPDTSTLLQDGPDAKPLGRGTRIELVLKEDMAEFLEERKVTQLLVAAVDVSCTPSTH